VILHEQDIRLASEIRASRDTYCFLLLSDFHHTHFRVFIRHLQQINQPCFRQCRDKLHSGIFYSLIHSFGIIPRNSHASILILYLVYRLPIMPYSNEIGKIKATPTKNHRIKFQFGYNGRVLRKSLRIYK
jgi:hypothetical protein